MIKNIQGMVFAALIVVFSVPSSSMEGVSGIETYEVDKTHTNIVWYISHMGFSRTIGHFRDFNGTIELNYDDPSNSKIFITIKTDSITTCVPDLDDQLKSAQFFNVEEYPEAYFESINIKLVEKDTANVTGNFTMLGNTNEILLNVRFNKRAMDPILNRMRTGFSIKSSLKRSEWGMDKMLAFVSDDINLAIEAEALRAPNE